MTQSDLFGSNDAYQPNFLKSIYMVIILKTIRALESPNAGFYLNFIKYVAKIYSF